MLVATAQMRYATMEENAAAAVIAKETSKTSGQAEDKKAYVDATRVDDTEVFRKVSRPFCTIPLYDMRLHSLCSSGV